MQARYNGIERRASAQAYSMQPARASDGKHGEKIGQGRGLGLELEPRRANAKRVCLLRSREDSRLRLPGETTSVSCSLDFLFRSPATVAVLRPRWRVWLET